MTTTNQVGATVRRAAHSDTLERLARMGFVAYGLTHLVVAWLALQIALGRAPADGDESGAFQLVAGQPFGLAVLWITVAGLAAMALWQLLEAMAGHRGEPGRERTIERVASAIRVVLYGAFAYSAAKMALQGKSSADAKQKTTTSALATTSGRAWVVVVGVLVLGVGIGLVIYGLIRRFEKHLKTAQIPAHQRKTVRWLGIAGYVAKGAAYTIAGGLLISAALTYDPAKSRGLDAALHAIVGYPWGRTLLILMALGIAAFGVFGLVQARYRKF
ncbi:MAG TPA: DUF1206 domain-containing protein [Micromonosporaceae bacterium]|nr:DUF1206 domain-containing protein [Micromonosporaceae bacterium]